MNFFTRFFVYFFVSIVFLIGISLFLFVTQTIPLEWVFNVLRVYYYDEGRQIILGALAGFLFIENFAFFYILSSRWNRKKFISFPNPSGRVQVSLVALENLVKRQATQLHEVKEVKTSMKATKKVIETRIKMKVQTDMSIPEITSEVQDMVKRKIENTIGRDKEVHVLIDVSEIVPERYHAAEKKDQKSLDEPEQPNIPFQGYRA
jgi:uncharacterized alkaline shock family protein YloU